VGLDTRHPVFRAQAEHWLEFLVREEVKRIDSCWINTLRTHKFSQAPLAQVEF